VTTYTFECRCGRKSPRFASKRESKAWHTRHVRDECVVRRSATAPVDAELAELRARVRRFKRIPMPEPEPIEAAGPRVLTYWAPGSNSRFGALRRVVVPAPVKRDAWGGRPRQ